MDDQAREILDQAYATLARTASVRVIPRDIGGPDAMVEWRRNMPKQEPPPTTADVEQKIRDMLPGIGTVLHEVRQQVRREFASSLATMRKEMSKRVDDDRRLARHELNSQRADHDRRLSRQQLRIEELQTTIAALEQKLAALTQHEATGKVIVPLRGQHRG